VSPLTVEYTTFFADISPSLSDKLIDNGLVERYPDKKDRRIINIGLTENGREFTFHHKEKLKADVSEKFSGLSDEELEQFLKSIANFQEVMAKTNMDGKERDKK